MTLKTMKNALVLNSKKTIYLHFKLLDRTVYIGPLNINKNDTFFSSRSTNETVKRKENFRITINY